MLGIPWPGRQQKIQAEAGFPEHFPPGLCGEMLNPAAVEFAMIPHLGKNNSSLSFFI